MKKHTFEWHGRKYYFLGIDKHGDKQYLEQAKWDCDWYWAIGYVNTFTNNCNPHLSKDILNATHFDYLFRKAYESEHLDYIDAFKFLFRESPFTDNEIWEILEIMKSAYTATKYSDMLYIGGAHITSNPASEKIKSEIEYKRINRIVIPGLMEALYKILEGDEE